ncbi:MAG: RNA 2',3'-cyclic phosphodiesterase [Candidatus Moranbacteria bacterium]|nr:RNA 2',3'-cyclic phosphodiesterase [Candidatus Moranbacteria bacterium]
MNERRLFFAIPLSSQTRTRLAREASTWESLPLFVTRPDHLHVTLLFLGFVSDEDVERYSEAAREICSETEPFEILFDGIVYAPEGESPKMLWLRGVESEPLLRLRNAFEAELSERPAEFQRFRPHVNLARLQRNRFALLPEDRRVALPKSLRIVEPVSSVVLFESVGAGAKREYLAMEEFPLGE